MSCKGSKNVEIEATLEEHEIVPMMKTARGHGPLAFALVAWGYEYGARISEFGMQLMKDTDLRLNRARPAHLKHGQKQAWHLFYKFCREALPLWLAEREAWALEPKRQLYLFPSRIKGHRCYVCRGLGKRPRLRRQDERRFAEGTALCEQCRGTGERWGLAAPEAYKIIHNVLVAAGIPNGRNHPHVLRHSIVTHLLNAGVAVKVVQDRVGHRSMETTLSYARLTDQALAESEGKLDARGIYDGWT
jgi:site-specific recombinase XerD